MVDSNDSIMFSVIIPYYNKGELLLDAVQSVLNQSYSGFELIVVDNNSTDQGMDLLKRINDSRIVQYVENRQGVSQARNIGIEKASHPFICFLDADDIWQSDNLLELKKLIEQYPNAGIYSNSYSFTESNGSKRIRNVSPESIARHVYQSNKFFLDFCNFDVPVNTNTVCIPRKILQSNGGFDPDLRMGEDILLWTKIMFQYPIIIGDYIGSDYRRNAPNRSDNPEKNIKELLHVQKFETWFNTLTPEEQQATKYFDAFIAKNLFACVMANIQVGQSRNARAFFFNRKIYSLPSAIRLFVAFGLAFLPAGFSNFLLNLMRKFDLVRF